MPASPWLDAAAPPAPALVFGAGALQITPGAGEAARWWAVRMRVASTWVTRVLFAEQRTLLVDSGVERVLVQAVDQAGNVSGSAEWRRP